MFQHTYTDAVGNVMYEESASELMQLMSDND